MMSGAKVLDFDAYGLFRAKHSHNYIQLFSFPQDNLRNLLNQRMFHHKL